MNIKKYVVLKDIVIDDIESAGSVSFKNIFVGCFNTLEEAEDLVRKDAPPAMGFNIDHNPGSYWERGRNNSFNIVEEVNNIIYSSDDNRYIYYILKINDTSENDEEKESLKRRNQKLEEQVENLKKRLNALTGSAATYKESPKKEFKVESKNKDGFHGISFFSRD
jgi:hypothetical protein